MILLIFFAFLAGVVTILSPCILPILPIVLSGSVGGGKRRPLGIVTGFIASFTFFTLALTGIVKATGISGDALRNISIVVILTFGFALLIPQFQLWLEQIAGKFSALAPKQSQNSGFFGGVLLGISLGLLWTPCVGPIIASVITLAATSAVTTSAVFITLAYSAGTGVPMLFITYGGRALLQKVPWLLANTAKIQKIFGVLMIATAVAIFFNVDRKFQAYVIQKFPQYGVGLTKLEDNEAVRKQLEDLQAPSAPTPAAVPVPTGEESYPQAPELIAGGKWFNSKPLTLSALRGKVVLVDFWTYTCINCIRTLPYLKSWHEKYADNGLVIIGIHTPEFAFEHNPDNVQKAIKDFGLKYPIMQDNDYATWNVYHNRYWPAKYFIDKNGKVRSSHFGEGEYNESEELIQTLLKEAGSKIDAGPVSNKEYSILAKTPETYTGYWRIENFASPEGVQPDKESFYTTQSDLPLNHFALGGMWTISRERALPSADSSLTFHFDAGQVFLVMRSINKLPGKVKISLDGNVISQGESGSDVKNGILTVIDDRLYSLVKLGNPGAHLLKLEFLDPNLELYAFTFG